VRQAKAIAKSGVKELIVTAQDTTQYGMDLYGERKLLPLLKELEKIEQLEWIRLLYLHPAHISNELIDHICQSEKICHYFELPLQHINDILLQSMNRHVTSERTIEIIKRIREKDPLATIRTTFIVGYPGETDEMYNELVEFVEKSRFERMGVFAFSEEEDTPAALLDHKIDEDIAEIRQDQLMGMQMDISSEIMRRWLGETMMVIIDDKSEDEDFDFVGRSQYDCPDIDGIVYINGQAKPGEIKKVKIVATWEYDLVGKIID
jgi:ribosomal protein S12 methylthiotransferase